jgi:hypothetical protein
MPSACEYWIAYRLSKSEPIHVLGPHSDSVATALRNEMMLKHTHIAEISSVFPAADKASALQNARFYFSTDQLNDTPS